MINTMHIDSDGKISSPVLGAIKLGREVVNKVKEVLNNSDEPNEWLQNKLSGPNICHYVEVEVSTTYP